MQLPLGANPLGCPWMQLPLGSPPWDRINFLLDVAAIEVLGNLARGFWKCALLFCNCPNNSVPFHMKRHLPYINSYKIKLKFMCTYFRLSVALVPSGVVVGYNPDVHHCCDIIRILTRIKSTESAMPVIGDSSAADANFKHSFLFWRDFF